MINKFRNSLSTKIIFSLLAILVPIILASFTTNLILTNMSLTYQDIAEEVELEIQPIKNVRVHLQRVVNVLDVFIATGRPEHKSDYVGLEKEVDASFDDIDLDNFAAGSERQNILSAKKNWQTIKSRIPSIFSDRDNKNIAAALNTMKQVDDLEHIASHSLNRASAQAEQEVQENLVQTSEDRARNIFLIGAVILLTLGIVIAASIYLLRSILKPLRELKSGVEEVQKGDLKHWLRVYRHDELGQVSKAFNEMTKRLDVYSARLNEIATHDDLTDLYNHREFYNQLENEAELTKRYSLFFSLIIFDIDFFKKVNDKYGHKTGDAVLASVAGVLKQTARASDICARYGGEEFTIILPQTRKEDASNIAKRICTQFSSNPIIIDNQTEPIKITISAGVAEFDRDTKDTEELFNKADSALYNAKDTGRNRVIIYREAA